MFIGREKELQELNRFYSRNDFQMIVLYGRRRVGKTTLLKEFTKDKSAVLFFSEQSNEKLNLEKISRELFDHFEEKHLENFTSWDKVFGYVGEKSTHERFILVLDEFPYLAESNKTILSILQHYIDNQLKDTKLYLVLCGSYVGFMEREVLGAKSPIFGRRTAQLHLKPFDYYDSAQFLQNFSNEDKVQLYAAFGGTPRYLSEIDNALSVGENLYYHYLIPTGYLYEETNLLLQQELREPGVYNAIVGAIASGAVKLNEIHLKTGEDAAKCAKYLSTLVNLGIVKKELPLGEKETSRKNLYRLADNMFYFWYRFVGPNKALIETDAGDIVLEKRVMPFFSEYIGPVFEEVCRDFLFRQNSQGKLPFLFTRIGRWWGNDVDKKQQIEIDLIATDQSTAMFCECKWRNEAVNEKILNQLIEKSNSFHSETNYYALFSKSGFTQELEKKALESERILLFTLDDLFQ